MTQPVLFAVEDGEHSAVTRGAAPEFSSKRKGKISEAAFALQAIIRGWDVVNPNGDPDDYDTILKRPSTRPILVQVKRAMRSVQDNCYRINASRSGGPDSKRRILYSHTAFDVLAAHLADVDRWVFYTRAELGNRTQTTYKLPTDRRQVVQRRAPDARDPDNWELLDQVAAMYSQESLTPKTADVLDLAVQMSNIP